jgi:hypothetical protein
MPIVLPTNVAPGSPITYEFFTQFAESQQQAALDATLAEVYPATGLTVHGTSVSDATTNTALVTVPAATIAGAVAGSVFRIRAWGIFSAPASSAATLAWHCYSGGSAGTELDNFIPVAAPLASAAANLWDVETIVNFQSATLVQCILIARMATSVSSTSAANEWIAGNPSATAVTVTAGTALTLNAVMGTAVSGSSFEGVGGYWSQEA